jgi:predicted pyridoxine 5'-phosphate oxidase superfamily flavin-nucleotide-binding protein
VLKQARQRNLLADEHFTVDIATVCPDGAPNLSPEGTTAAWDHDHLVFADIRSPQSVQNIEHNPSAEVNVVDPLVRKGYRFKGRGLSIARMKSSSAGARCTGTRDLPLQSEPWS